MLGAEWRDGGKEEELNAKGEREEEGREGGRRWCGIREQGLEGRCENVIPIEDMLCFWIGGEGFSFKVFWRCGVVQACPCGSAICGKSAKIFVLPLPTT